MASGDSNPEPSAAGEKPADNNATPRQWFDWKSIPWFDFSNTVVAIAALGVAYATYLVASDTSDLKKAVSKISDLASQTKREADALGAQFDQVKRQADALSAQLHQMKRQATASEAIATNAQAQTKAISEQSVTLQRSLAESDRVIIIVTIPEIKSLVSTPNEPEGMGISFNCYIGNYGRSPAIVNGIDIEVWSDVSGPANSLQFYRPPFSDTVLPVNDPLKLPFHDIWVHGKGTYAEFLTGMKSFFISGRISYKNIAGEERLYTFRRKYIYGQSFFDTGPPASGDCPSHNGACLPEPKK